MELHQIDFANVDLGPAHNGRVAARRIFEERGERFIFDRGRRVPVIKLFARGSGIVYVTTRREP